MSLNIAADDCADILRVLGDPTRLKVVRLLMGGPRHVGALNDEIGVDQSLLSHHLRIMREAGLLEAERDGKAVRYRLSARLDGRRRAQHLELGCCTLSFGE